MKSSKVIPVSPCSKNDLDDIATRILYNYQKEVLINIEPVNIEDLFEIDIPEITGVLTGYDSLNPGILGVTNAATMTSYVDVELAEATDSVNKRRYRATVAHESAHCIKHVKQLKEFASILGKDEMSHYRTEKSNIPSYKDPEWQAWYLGGALLMPKANITKAYEKYGELELPNIFDVNISFVRIRLDKLGLTK